MHRIFTHPLSDEIASLDPTAARLYGLVAFSLGQSIQVNNGTLHPAAIAWLSLGLIFLILAQIPNPGRLLNCFRVIPFNTLLAILVAIQWTELLIWGIRCSPPGPAPFAWYLPAMLLCAASLLLALPRLRQGVAPASCRWPTTTPFETFPQNTARRATSRLRACVRSCLSFSTSSLPSCLSARTSLATLLLILGHLLAAACVIHSSPRPGIDVWQFQQHSASALLHGQNPYTVRYADPYPPDSGFYGPGVSQNGFLTCSFPYPPLSLLLTLPGRLAGDVRWSHLAALELSVLVLAMLAPGHRGFWLTALLLLSPRSLLVIKAGWTEPLVFLALTMVLYSALRAPRMLWLSIGLLVAVKQYAALALPLTLLLLPRPWSWRAAIRFLLPPVLLAAAITVPFLLWNPGAFLRSVLLWQFRQPFRPDALSYPAMLSQLTGLKLSAVLAFIAASTAIAWSLRHSPRSPAGFASALALVFLIFFALNKQAFCNYYYFALAASVSASALTQTSLAPAAIRSAVRSPRLAHPHPIPNRQLGAIVDLMQPAASSMSEISPHTPP